MKTKTRRATYYKAVSELTRLNYPKVEGYFYGAHLDHRIPKRFGFTHDIEIEIIGSLSNLRFLTPDENIEKGSRITADSIAAMRENGLNDLADTYEPRICS